MSFLRPRIPSEKGLGAHRERFDYSETRLSANKLVKTTPKLISLSKHTGKLLPNSFAYQKQPLPTTAETHRSSSGPDRAAHIVQKAQALRPIASLDPGA